MAVLDSDTPEVQDEPKALSTLEKRSLALSNARAAKRAKKASGEEEMITMAKAVEMVKKLVAEEREKMQAEFNQRGANEFANAFTGSKDDVAKTAKPISKVDGQRHNPRRNIRFDATLHYLKIQGDSPDYMSNLQMYLDIPSPTNPDMLMYWPYSNDVEITGHKAIHLLCCTKQDYDARLAMEDKAGRLRHGKTDPLRKQAPTWGPAGEVEVGDAFYGLEEDYIQRRGVPPA